ncbi:cytochrome c oxidase subunit II [Nibricoccus sp. IMCC34717]|uniref:cytochrome c oxidase subunit II n=1 Tax=Nibricoccus sp. IMCC34717 TaxID=3034021 RepID=UPI00384FEB60
MPVPRFLRSPLQRLLTTTAALLLPLLLGGWIHGPQSTFDTHGPVAKAQLEVFYVTLWVTGVIFVIVAAVLTYATFKFKARNAADEHAEPPPQSHGNPLVELSLIFASVVALVVIAIPTLRAIWFTYDVPEADKPNAYTVNATGLQWWFRFEYPAEEVDNDGVKGKLTVANELVIPAGRPVRINLRTYDVIHSFWVPKLAGKVDMMPNRANHLWLLADQPGYYWGQCAEYCGESHAVMRFRVIALPEQEFRTWVDAQKKPARTANAPQAALASYDTAKKKRNSAGYSAEFDADPLGAWKRQQQAPASEDLALIAQGRELFQQKSCIACHVIRGHSGGGNPAAPDLTHVATRTTIAGGLLETTPANIHRWVTDPNGVKPGNKMYVGLPLGGSVMPGYMLKDYEQNTLTPHIEVNDTEARALVAYLLSLK